MSKKIILDRDELYQKYTEDHLSQQKIAEYFNCSIDTVRRNLKEYGIKSNKPSDYCSNIVQLTEIQKSVLYGALLGDGSLIKHKNGINAQFSYLSKSEQHVKFIAQYFEEYISKIGIRSSSYFDQRTNKTYYRTRFRTITDIGFTEEYNKWYLNGVKHIPNDLILNPMICLIWYIGDGGICNGKQSQYIKLATQCFDKKEQEDILLPQLSDFNAKLMKADIGKNGNQQYFIYIPHLNMLDFLNYIGDCPFSDYEYKWNYKEYVNVKPINHTIHENEFCEMYKNGMTYYAIAKQFNIEPNAVKYYLKKNKLYNERSYTQHG